MSKDFVCTCKDTSPSDMCPYCYFEYVMGLIAKNPEFASYEENGFIPCYAPCANNVNQVFLLIKELKDELLNVSNLSQTEDKKQ